MTPISTSDMFTRNLATATATKDGKDLYRLFEGAEGDQEKRSLFDAEMVSIMVNGVVPGFARMSDWDVAEMSDINRFKNLVYLRQEVSGDVEKENAFNTQQIVRLGQIVGVRWFDELQKLEKAIQGNSLHKAAFDEKVIPQVVESRVELSYLNRDYFASFTAAISGNQAYMEKAAAAVEQKTLGAFRKNLRTGKEFINSIGDEPAFKAAIERALATRSDEMLLIRMQGNTDAWNFMYFLERDLKRGDIFIEAIGRNAKKMLQEGDVGKFAWLCESLLFHPHFKNERDQITPEMVREGTQLLLDKKDLYNLSRLAESASYEPAKARVMDEVCKIVQVRDGDSSRNYSYIAFNLASKEVLIADTWVSHSGMAPAEFKEEVDRHKGKYLGDTKASVFNDAARVLGNFAKTAIDPLLSGMAKDALTQMKFETI